MHRALIVCALALFGLAGLAGCGAGGEYVYQPLAPSGKPAPGGPVARYRLPGEAPTGEVRISSPGIITMTNRETKRTYHALRIAISLRDDRDPQPWRMAPRAQLLLLPGGARIAPFLVTEKGRRVSGIVEIPKGTTRTLELFYALPASQAREERLPNFGLHWQVETMNAVVEHDTRFTRLHVPLRTRADESSLLGADYYDPISPSPVWFEPILPAPR